MKRLAIFVASAAALVGVAVVGGVTDSTAQVSCDSQPIEHAEVLPGEGYIAVVKRLGGGGSQADVIYLRRQNAGRSNPGIHDTFSYKPCRLSVPTTTTHQPTTTTTTTTTVAPTTTTTTTTPPTTTTTPLLTHTWTHVNPGQVAIPSDTTSYPYLLPDQDTLPNSAGVCFYRNDVFNRCDPTPNPYQMYSSPGFTLQTGDVLRGQWMTSTGQNVISTHTVGGSSSTTSTTSTPTTISSAPTTTAPGGETFPTPSTTGSRVPVGQLTVFNGEFFTSNDGQVIERLLINGNLNVNHDNVVVRDVVVRYNHNYGVDLRNNGTGCAQNARLSYIEIDGANAADNHYAVYGEGCPWTIDHAYVHNIGSGVLMMSNNTLTDSYIYSTRYETTGLHRNAVQHHGGSYNTLINNVLYCEGGGCSSALALYGEVAPIDDWLIEHNLLATTGGYCTYTGSLSYKPYPLASNVRYINNHFSTRFRPNCGTSGPVTGDTAEVRGNVWQGNVWHETGQPL